MNNQAGRLSERDRTIAALAATLLAGLGAYVGSRALDLDAYARRGLYPVLFVLAAFLGVRLACGYFDRGRNRWTIGGMATGMLSGVAVALVGLAFLLQVLQQEEGRRREWLLTGFVLCLLVAVGRAARMILLNTTGVNHGRRRWFVEAASLVPSVWFCAFATLQIFDGTGWMWNSGVMDAALLSFAGAGAFVGAYLTADAPGARLWLGVPLSVFWLTIFRPTFFESLRDLIPGHDGTRILDVLDLYPGTAVSVGTLLIAAARLRNRRPQTAASLSACFLPAYVAGIEALNHLKSLLTSHFTGSADLLAWLRGEAFVAACVVVCVVVIGILAAWSLGHRSRIGLPLPPAGIAAMLVSVILNWGLIYCVFQPVAPLTPEEPDVSSLQELPPSATSMLSF